MSSPDPRSMHEDMAIEAGMRQEEMNSIHETPEGPCRTDPYAGQEEMESIHETLERFRRTLVGYDPDTNVYRAIQSLIDDIETLRSAFDDLESQFSDLDYSNGLDDKIKFHVRAYIEKKFKD